MVQALQVQSSVLDGVLLWVSGLSSLKWGGRSRWSLRPFPLRVGCELLHQVFKVNYKAVWIKLLVIVMTIIRFNSKTINNSNDYNELLLCIIPVVLISNAQSWKTGIMTINPHIKKSIRLSKQAHEFVIVFILWWENWSFECYILLPGDAANSCGISDYNLSDSKDYSLPTTLGRFFKKVNAPDTFYLHKQ